MARNMTDPVAQGLRRRHAAERRFRLCGIAAILAAVGALLILLGSMIAQGWPAFSQAHVHLDIVFAADVIDPNGTRKAEELNEANYAVLIRRALRDVFPQVHGRRDRRALAKLVSAMAPDTLRIMVLAEP